MSRYIVGKVAEIPPGERKIVVPFRGRAGIGVFNVGGTFYAVRNICPHKQGPLCLGNVSGRVSAAAPITATDANIIIEGEGEVLRCPWHQWPFDIATGRCLVDDSFAVKTYPVTVEGDELVIDV